MRATPFEIAFGSQADERFPAIRQSLAESGRDPHDLDAFLLDRAAVTLLRELVPEEGVGEAVTQHAALLHHAFCYWDAGGWLISLSKERTITLLQAGPSSRRRPTDLASGEAATREGGRAESPSPRAYYAQFPERLVWAELGEEEPHQPLDGLFVRPWPGGGLFVLGIFGMHPGREGFSIVDVDGYPAEALARDDGSPLFSPSLPGGEAAGLFSIVGGEELLELAARTIPLVVDAVERFGVTHHPHQVVPVR